MEKEFLKLENKLVLELEIEPISPLIIKLGDGSEEENSNKEKSESVISFVTSDSPRGNLVEYDKNKKTTNLLFMNYKCHRVFDFLLNPLVRKQKKEWSELSAY